MDDSNAGSAPSMNQRRKSFVEMLNPRAFSNSSSVSASPSIAVPAAPGAANGRKSMSNALGLAGGGSSQDSAFNAFSRQRRASISTSSTSGSPELRNSFDENAVIEDDDKIGPMNSPPSPSFARRLSFGAQALRDAKQTGTSPGNNAGRRPSSSLFSLKEDLDNTNHKPVARSSETAKTGGEGFNWSDSMRARTKRASISTNPFASGHNRSKSFNPTPPEPPQEMPKQAAPAPVPAAKMKKPDHLGERMLRGEFMMD